MAVRLHVANQFARTKLSDIVRPASSSQLVEVPDRVRSFGGYNMVDANGRWERGLRCWCRSSRMIAGCSILRPNQFLDGRRPRRGGRLHAWVPGASR